MKKNLLVVTGGSGFVGSNLIKFLVKKTKFKIVSIDDYSSGIKKNEIKSKRVKYLRGHTKNVYSLLDKYKKNIHEKGNIYNIDDLLELVTGEKLNTKHYENHIINRYVNKAF